MYEEGEHEAEFIEGVVHTRFGVGDVCGEHFFEHHAVEGFVDHTGQSHNDEGQGVFEHAFYEGDIEAVFELGKGF